MSKIKVFVATHCEPCKGVKELLEKGHFLVNGAEAQVELVDIETEEGFVQIFEGLGGVPAAYRDGKKCNIRIDEETQTLMLECHDGAENPGT